MDNQADTDEGDPWAGKTVRRVRRMSDDELAREGWDRAGVNPEYAPPVVEFEDGSTLYASRDPEGNGPGALFGTDADDTPVWVPPPDSPAAQGADA